jgi:polyhydroxybutyrate depolymerase
MIDDFESAIGRILTNENRRGLWVNYDDHTGGKLVREVLARGTRVLHVTSAGFTKWGAGIAAILSPPRCGYDASVYAGLRFRARGSGRVRLMLAGISSTPLREGGKCTLAGDNCYDRPGVWVNLDDQWQDFEYPFCAFVPEGWGGGTAAVEPEALLGINFRMESGHDFELWLDDLAFFQAKNATHELRCGVPCPLEAAPRTAKLDPSFTTATLTQELTLHNFEQSTKLCGKLIRRYLSYVPKRLTRGFSGPVLMMLHGSGANAESSVAFMARNRFNELAARDGFVMVYGNAAPSAFSDPSPGFANTGTWRQGFYDDGQVDDVDYLGRVLDDLHTRQVISGNNPVYLTGISNGGGMVLTAARRQPQRFRAIAPVMPFDGARPEPVPNLRDTNLRRVLFVYSAADPGLPADYNQILSTLPAVWSRALGIRESAIANPRMTLLPDMIQEGESYAGSDKIALFTRNSRVTQSDISDPSVDARVRVLRLDHAGHFWPNPKQDTETWVLQRWGFRNQDFDAADAVWDFFSGS